MEEKLIIELDDNKIKYGVFVINENNQFELIYNIDAGKKYFFNVFIDLLFNLC